MLHIEDLLFFIFLAMKFNFIYLFKHFKFYHWNKSKETHPIEIPLARRVRISNYTKYRQTVRQFRASIEIYSIILTSIKYSIELKKFQNGFLIPNNPLILSRISWIEF